MKKQLSIVLVEDNKMDVKLVTLHLKEGGVSTEKLTVVDNDHDFRNALNPKPDIILSDFKLPHFNGLLALKIRNEMCPNVPFLIVTGSDKEESAIDCIKKGADDYILKSHRNRLVSAMRSAIGNNKARIVNKIVHEISEVALSMYDIHIVMDFVYQKINELLVAKNMFIALYDKQREQYEFVFFKDEIDDVHRFTGKDSKKSFSEYVRTSGRSLLADEEKQNKMVVAGLIEMVGTPAKEWIGIPLVYNQEVVGILSIQNHHDESHYTENDLRYLEMLSSTIAMILIRNKINEEVVKKTKAIDFSPAITLITDANGNIEYINSVFEKITGFKTAPLIGHNLSVFDEDDANNFYQKIDAALKAGRSFTGEFLSHHRNGKRFWLSVNLSPIKDEAGKIIHFVIISQDITERKHAQQELHEALMQAEEDNRLTFDVLATMAHEIRTPLNQMVDFSKTLAKDETLSPELRDNYLNRVMHSRHTLLLMIDNGIEMAKAQSKRVVINHNPFHLKTALSKRHAYFNTMMKQQGKKDLLLAFIPDKKAPKECRLDESHLILIINNLLDNAIKFTDTGSVSFGYQYETKEGSAYYRFFVADTGIGMDEKRSALMAQKLSERDEKPMKIYDGQGLGLTVCATWTQLLGGKMWFESKHGKGTTFYCEIPE